MFFFEDFAYIFHEQQEHLKDFGEFFWVFVEADPFADPPTRSELPFAALRIESLWQSQRREEKGGGWRFLGGELNWEKTLRSLLWGLNM